MSEVPLYAVEGARGGVAQDRSGWRDLQRYLTYKKRSL